MTTIDRDRLRRYLSHAAMLLPPDERVVTVAEGAAMLDALSAAEHRATRAEAQSETRRQQAAYWQERAEGFEARLQAVRDVLAHHPYGGPGQEDAVRRALDAP
ncbi:hypothetical protein ACTXMZ_15610 [Brachybacterium alimentarium]|uniref:hypothetical protein n=1 Tax=Brachybacterium alimentarium TaxID=47845 RepID=UPI003FD51D3C